MAEGLNERIEKIRDRIGDLNARLKEQIDSMIDTCGTVKALAEQIREEVGQDPPAPPSPPLPRREPGLGKIYFFLGSEGDIRSFHWDGAPIDKHIYNSANVFMSEAEARFALERRKVLAEMREWAGYNYDGAYIYYHRPSDEILINWNGDSTYCFGDIRFKCVDDARNCIKAVGEERLKKYYFGISDRSSTICVYLD